MIRPTISGQKQLKLEAPDGKSTLQLGTEPWSAPAPPAEDVSIGPAAWRTVAAGLVRTARPKQWMKNVLVFAAPGAAGVLTDRSAVAESIVAFIAFCLVASGTYFFNDTLDVRADRCHPIKRLRPIPAGIVPLPVARFTGAALVAGGVGVSAIDGSKLVVVLAIYVAVQIAYSNWLKQEAILDLAAVASGFVLRAIAGGVATGVPISEWFLIVATFGSLFMVTGKRTGERNSLGDERGAHRATLAVYTASFLQSALIMSSTVTMMAYCLWAFESERAVHGGIWFQLSILPFGLALLRYALLIDQGHGGSPEDVVLADRSLQMLAILWLLVFALGVYGG